MTLDELLSLKVGAVMIIANTKVTIKEIKENTLFFEEGGSVKYSLSNLRDVITWELVKPSAPKRNELELVLHQIRDAEFDIQLASDNLRSVMPFRFKDGISKELYESVEGFHKINYENNVLIRQELYDLRAKRDNILKQLV
jgi:hypothetical protein